MHTSDKRSASDIFNLRFTELMDGIRLLHIFNWNLTVLISLYLSVYCRGKRMFPVTPFNTLSVLNIFWLKDVSHHHFWQCLSELKALSYISHVQRLAQKAISVGIPNSKFPLEIHQFIKKRLGLYLEFSPLTLPKQPLARVNEAAHTVFTVSIYKTMLCWNSWVKRGDRHSGMTVSLLLCCDVIW